MPRYLIKRTFPDRFEAPADNGSDTWTKVISRNAEEGVTWLHSYVSDDGHTLFCIYDAPTPEAITALEARITKTIPLGRFGKPEQIAKTVLFLASDDASNIQGTEIFVDGGSTSSPAGAPIYRG